MEHKDLDELLNMVSGKLDTLRRWVQLEVKKLEERIEENDKQIAVLVMGFGEQVVMIESLVGQLIYASDEEKAKFRTDVAEARKEMFKLMQEGAGVAMDDRDSATPDAVEDVDPEQQPPASEE